MAPLVDPYPQSRQFYRYRDAHGVLATHDAGPFMREVHGTLVNFGVVPSASVSSANRSNTSNIFARNAGTERSSFLWRRYRRPWTRRNSMLPTITSFHFAELNSTFMRLRSPRSRVVSSDVIIVPHQRDDNDVSLATLKDQPCFRIPERWSPA